MLQDKWLYNENKIFETVVKIALLALVVYGSYLILKPFMGIVVWSIIIAITINPIITMMSNALKWSRTKSSVVFSIITIALILIQSVSLGIVFSDNIAQFVAEFKAGTLHIPAPNEKIATWPIVGNKIYPIWLEASTNFNLFIANHKEELMPYLKSIASALGGGVTTILMFITSMIIAALFTSTSEANTAFSNTLATKIAGEQGPKWLRLSVMTVRSIVQGVIGIAIIQSVIAYVGCLLFGVPLAVVIALLIMFIAIAQLPAIIVLIFPMIYMFSTASTQTAVGFAVFAVILGLSDNVLKPLLLGRGVDAPMLVVLLGAIGGMLVWGVLGLFIGSVLLAVAYKLFLAWLENETQEQEPSANKS